ncbi:hypothetical protein N665_1001s0009 [Sinapis alba]|nr:hypothetical protein N665_1001s0009 [Sinapis alba]
MHIKAKKPSLKIGSSFSLEKPAKTHLKVNLEDDFGLIDEDSLLTEEDLKKPQLPAVVVKPLKKTCKNCVCGRSEIKKKKPVKLDLTKDQIKNPQSSCGSVSFFTHLFLYLHSTRLKISQTILFKCVLVDAFRWGTCSYKGLPPFKLGEKLFFLQMLSQNFLEADI